MNILNGIPVLIIQAVSELGYKPRSSQLYYAGPFQYPVLILWLLLYPWLYQTALFQIVCYVVLLTEWVEQNTWKDLSIHLNLKYFSVQSLVECQT